MLLVQQKPKSLDRNTDIVPPTADSGTDSSSEMESESLTQALNPLPISRSFILLLTDPGRLNREAAAVPSLAGPLKLYGLGAGLGLALAEIFGERNTGALYVFGGGVFADVAGIGEWIAFLVSVPILAAGLTALDRSPEGSWRRNVIFALHFCAVSGLATAVEVLLVAAFGLTALVGLAGWLMLLLVGAFYVLSIIDTYGRSNASLWQGIGGLVAVLTAWLATTLLLVTFTDFRL